jgi:hypothetical protein
LQYVITESKSVHEADIKPLLNALKNLSLFGTQANPAPTPLTPTGSIVNTKMPLKFNMASEDDSIWKPFSSDSEHSDSELQDRHQTWKVRLHALGCVAAIAKASTKLFYGYWGLFIPSSSSPLTPTIFTCIMNDPSSKVRSIAVTALSAIVDGSKTFLMAADDRYIED